MRDCWGYPKMLMLRLSVGMTVWGVYFRNGGLWGWRVILTWRVSLEEKQGEMQKAWSPVLGGGHKDSTINWVYIKHIPGFILWKQIIRQNVKGRVLFRDKHPIHKSEWEIERWRTRSWTVTEAWQSLSQHARTLGVHIEHIRTIRELLIWTETDWQSVPGCGELWTGMSLDKLFAAGGYVLSADYTPTSWAPKASMLHSSVLNPKHLIKGTPKFPISSSQLHETVRIKRLRFMRIHCSWSHRLLLMAQCLPPTPHFPLLPEMSNVKNIKDLYGFPVNGL